MYVHEESCSCSIFGSFRKKDVGVEELITFLSSSYYLLKIAYTDRRMIVCPFTQVKKKNTIALVFCDRL